MTQMIRKHFLLPLPLDERIKLVARKDHKTEAAVIRELLETALETKQWVCPACTDRSELSDQVP